MKSKRIFTLMLALVMTLSLAACGKKPFTNTFAMFAAGVLFGTTGIKVLGSKDTKKA